ncbi:hypothetical protein [Dyella mobilis]|uniref:Uncharacterized protein n=1 Tax=Dyella mobilis TaxID=1849582 RepID=A0ABS2KBN0_9GAMM|nr:hypothetical protein [Dyella mobilis]MBM7128504.1 hypothetical protein [Dyella mobilis]GLQ99595.1 hypothetical protein GCM10007863_40150 [Dyella mobilis]
MAEPDHTVLARLSGLPDHLFDHLPVIPPDTVDDDEAAFEEIHVAVAGIEEVKRVITHLLGDSDAFREMLESGKFVFPKLWPLPASTYAGLLVAIHFLDQCSDVLRHVRHR